MKDRLSCFLACKMIVVLSRTDSGRLGGNISKEGPQDTEPPEIGESNLIRMTPLSDASFPEGVLTVPDTGTVLLVGLTKEPASAAMDTEDGVRPPEGVQNQAFTTSPVPVR